MYRSELKLRSVRTAIYGASLLCVALVSLVSDRRSRVVCPSRAQDEVYLVSVETRSRDRRSERRVESLMVARVMMANGHRKWLAPFAMPIERQRIPRSSAHLPRSDATRRADGIIYSVVFSAENLVASSLGENETHLGN